MSSNHKLVLALIVFVVCAVGLVGIFLPWLAVGLAVLICAMLVLLRTALMPAGYGANKVRLLSLTLSAGLVASYGAWSEILDAAVKVIARQPEVQRVAPWLAEIDLGHGPSITTLVFFLLVVWIVNHYMADRSIAGAHPEPLKKDFPDLSVRSKIEAFCSALRQHLETTDREANWSPTHYTALEAEVEVLGDIGSTERRRIVDLQAALRAHHQTRSFLILGDPGSGKSVALRKLARDMLQEVGETGRIPIYINLREWLPRTGRRTGAWTPETPPTFDDLKNFVIDNIKARGDLFTEEFVDEYFLKLWQHGRLFFLFDSFDEIPELLDVNEESWLLDALSDLLYRFIATNPASRGALASRVFRRPTQRFMSEKMLEIRPLSEHRIEQSLTRFKPFTPELRTQLFRDRADLVPIARNPFLMTLLGEWVNEHRSLPQTQAQLYESYLHGRLTKCATRITQAGLTVPQVLEGATAIASFVFDSPDYGLEAPVQVIGTNESLPNAAAIIDILSYARLARVTSGESRSFAFVHRRFLEYLVTMVFLTDPERLPVEHIPTDSRGRDAMVLYAQVCSSQEAERIARLCWNEVQKYFDDPKERLRAIHCLRFLVDAFRSRRDAVAPFVNELAEFIASNIGEGKNLVSAKIFLETTGLLSESQAIPILQTAIGCGNPWLQETAFRACRHISNIQSKLKIAINNYIMELPILKFTLEYKSLIFSLQLSEALHEAHHTARWRYINILSSATTAPIILLISPSVASLLIILIPLILFIFFTNTPRSHETKDMLIFMIRFSFITSVIGSWYACTLAVQTLTWPLSAAPFLAKNIIHITAIILLTDWSWPKIILNSLIKPRKLDPDMIKITAAVIILFILILSTFVYLIQFINISKINSFIPTLLYLFTPIVIGSATFPPIHNHITNRSNLNKIPITPQMSRIEIAQGIRTLTSSDWQIKFINQLSVQKIQATGDWPDDFQLTVGSDPAITELARLEERWLKLDR